MADEIQTITVTGDAYIPSLGISVEAGDTVQYHLEEDRAILDKVDKNVAKKSKKEAS